MSCALAGLVVLYASSLKEYSFRNGHSKGLQYHVAPDSSVCTTPDCVTAAARLLQNMDPSVDPCQNFYQYACGGWLERHVIPETSSLHSVFNILRDELEIVLKGILETESERDRQAFKKAKMLYRSCMNESVIEQRDSQPLLKLIDSIGDWPVASEDWNSTAGTEDTRLDETLATLNAHYNKKVLLEMFVWPDDRDSSRHIIHIDQPSLGMPSRDYYLNDGNYKKVREAYLQFMVSMVKIAREDRNLTQDDEHVWDEVKQVMELEREIANATSPAEERNDITVLYNKMTLRELQDTFGLDGFNWTRYIQGIMESVSIVVNPEELIVVYCSPYLDKLNNILPRYDRRTVQNYLVWMLLMERVSSLSRRFKDVRAHYRKVSHAHTYVYACVFYLLNPLFFQVGELIRKIQEAFVETVEELNWMDDQSKEKAREKAMAISEQIGYPDYILQEETQKLDQEYTHVGAGGMHCFWSPCRKREESYLPGLDLDHKQLFFLNFAQVWCGACRPEYAIQSIKTDPHSPLEYRVLGSLQNFEAFSEAFHCQRGAPMNPEEKCRVW
uniref:Membrane metallo-endopeptidase-like 1 n=1 Tax=Astyanax mexicanus TaxID=7994 RepID=A0A8B9J6V1_ASTMX